MAQDALLSAVLNDLVHREEVSSVVELADDLEFSFELCSNVRRHLALVASARALKRKLAQPPLLTSSGGKVLFWVPITKIIEAERTLFRNVECATEARWVVCEEASELIRGFEVVFCVCTDGVARLGKDFSPTNTGQNVL